MGRGAGQRERDPKRRALGGDLRTWWLPSSVLCPEWPFLSTQNRHQEESSFQVGPPSFWRRTEDCGRHGPLSGSKRLLER